MYQENRDPRGLEEIESRFWVSIDHEKLATAEPYVRMAVHHAQVPIAHNRREMERFAHELENTSGAYESIAIERMMKELSQSTRRLWEVVAPYEKKVPYVPGGMIH